MYTIEKFCEDVPSAYERREAVIFAWKGFKSPVVPIVPAKGLIIIFLKNKIMKLIERLLLLSLLGLSLNIDAAEYMAKNPYQASRAFSPGVITNGGKIVWLAGQTATVDKEGKDIANNFEAQVKKVMFQIDTVLKNAGGNLSNLVQITVFIKEPRYGDKFVEMRKGFFQNGNYPGSALITVSNFVRPGIEIEIQGVGVIGDSCSKENSCSEPQ